MDFAVVLVVFSRLKTLRMITGVDFGILSNILSEVQSLSWEQVDSDTQLEIFITDKSVLVQVKLVKNMIKLTIRQLKTPKIKEELQFTW